MEIPVRHVVHRAGDGKFAVPTAFESHSDGFSRWAMVDHLTPGALHTGFGVNQLAAGGQISNHLHSFEETIYMLEGTAVLQTPEATVELVAGDYGMIPLGVPHAWQNSSDTACRWADLLTPQPRPWYKDDTVLLAGIPFAPPLKVDPRDPRCRSFGHIETHNMDPAMQTQDMLLASASMRTALLVYSGITLKMMSDSDLGAQLSTMFMVQYEPRGLAGKHDHPFEETYLILDGEVDGTFDEVTYRLRPGDVAFAGVGSVHEFNNPTGSTVRWLETQSPAPPARHSYRFARDWNYLNDKLEKEQS